jgi:hypothetical protein
MEVPDPFRPDRSVVEVGALTDHPNDRAYWHSKTPAERWEALELLRQIAYGYDPATARLQRVLEIVELKTR